MAMELAQISGSLSSPDATSKCQGDGQKRREWGEEVDEDKNKTSHIHSPALAETLWLSFLIRSRTSGSMNFSCLEPFSPVSMVGGPRNSCSPGGTIATAACWAMARAARLHSYDEISSSNSDTTNTHFGISNRISPSRSRTRHSCCCSIVGVADGVPPVDIVDIPVEAPFGDGATTAPGWLVAAGCGAEPAAACCAGLVLTNESYSRSRIISRVCRHDSLTWFGLVSFSAAVTYSRTCVFCFWITCTFFGSSMSMFSSGRRTDRTGGSGDVTIARGPCGSLFRSCSRNSCCFSCVRDEMFSCEKLVLRPWDDTEITLAADDAHRLEFPGGGWQPRTKPRNKCNRFFDSHHGPGIPFGGGNDEINHDGACGGGDRSRGCPVALKEVLRQAVGEENGEGVQRVQQGDEHQRQRYCAQFRATCSGDRSRPAGSIADPNRGRAEPAEPGEISVVAGAGSSGWVLVVVPRFVAIGGNSRDDGNGRIGRCDHRFVQPGGINLQQDEL
uniref:Uncharacterized protein n=1 Tax=Anopheles farauti TaxID=69004 RepID=A0A182QGV5_9DIPT